MVIQSPNAKNQSGIFGNTNLGVEKQNVTDNKKASKTENGTLTVNGNLFANPVTGVDKAQKKKAEAQKQAMQIVKDAFHTVQDMKDTRTEARAQNDDLNAKNKELQETIKQYEADRDELLEKAGSDDEKQQIMIDFEKRTGSIQKEINDNEGTILENIATSKGTTKALLKSQDMYKANVQADDIMDAAGKELVGNLFKDAMDKLEEKREEEKKEAEEKAEKKEEEEKALEKTKEESPSISGQQKEAQSDTSQPIDASDSYKVISEDMQDDINKDLQKILDENSLLDEDLKGIVVNKMG